MATHEYKIHRRQAIGLVVAACGGVGIRSALAQPGFGCGDETMRQIRELHWQLFEFNR